MGEGKVGGSDFAPPSRGGGGSCLLCTLGLIAHNTQPYWLKALFVHTRAHSSLRHPPHLPHIDKKGSPCKPPWSQPFKPLQRKAVQWPFYQDRKPKREPSERWPASGHFYQRGNSQMALDLSRGLRIPYDPTQRIYQRPGQAIFNQERPNGHFLSRQKRSRLEPRMANPIRKPKRRSFRALATSNGRFVETGSQERVLPSVGQPLQAPPATAANAAS